MNSQITDELIAATIADPNVGSVELIDRSEPGLRIRIGAERARWSFMTSATEHARLRISLGTWPTVTVPEVRKLVGRLKATFEAPVATEPDVLTIAQLVERYDARKLSQLRKGRVMLRAISVALKSVWGQDANGVTRRHISEIVDTMAERAPIHANRVLAYLKAFFGWAVGRGYLDANPASGISKPSRETTRDRTPSIGELVEIWEAATALGYPFGQAIKLLMLTATRRDEVGAMRTDEIALAEDGRSGCWTLPASRSKNGRAIRMPLGYLARGITEEALEARTSVGALLFTTTGRTPISGWSKAKARLDSSIRAERRRRHIDAEMPSWRIHDLRRAFATAACDVLKIDPAVADRCLNHVGSATTSTVSRIYGRNEMFDQRSDALLKWEKLLVEAGCTVQAGSGAADPPGSASNTAGD